MRINEEQLEGHIAAAERQREEYKKTLTPKQLTAFVAAEKLSEQFTRDNIPFVLILSAKQDDSVFRFSNFFSKKFKDKLSEKATMHVWEWVRRYCLFFTAFLRDIGYFRVCLWSRYNHQLVIDTDPEES